MPTISPAQQGVDYTSVASVEQLLLGMVVAVVPLAQVALSAFLVTFRHVFYALPFPLQHVKSGPGRRTPSSR